MRVRRKGEMRARRLVGRCAGLDAGVKDVRRVLERGSAGEMKHGARTNVMAKRGRRGAREGAGSREMWI